MKSNVPSMGSNHHFLRVLNMITINCNSKQEYEKSIYYQKFDRFLFRSPQISNGEIKQLSNTRLKKEEKINAHILIIY